MKRLPVTLLLLFAMIGLGCEGNPFGCSGKNDRPIDLRLGTPGVTKWDNQLPANDNVKTLNDDETIEFQNESGEAIINHSVDREINVGDIIVANSEQRYLVRVKEVIKRDSGSTQTILRQARIADIVGDENGSLTLESTPVFDLEDIDRIARLAKDRRWGDASYETDSQGRMVIRDLELFNVDINGNGNISGGTNKILGIPITNPYEKFSVSSAAGGKYRAVINEAIVDVVPTIRSDAKWESGKISHLETRLDTKVRYRVDITYEAAGTIQLEALIDAFMPKKVIPFRVPGPVPVYLDIELGIPAGASLKATKEGKTRIVFESEYEFFTVMDFDHETGISTEKDRRVKINDKMIETKEGDLKLEAELFLKPQITARLYRVVGPHAYLKPYVRGEVEWPSREKKDDLFIGVTGGVGIELSEPIFLGSLVSFDSGKLFDWNTSFDLDEAGTPAVAALQVGQNVRDTVTVDQIGPEGFVRLNLKEHLDDGFLRYELLQSTQTGLTVPSDTFYMDGELYYYPMPDSREETFTVRIFGKNNSKEDVTIAIKVNDSVISEVSKDRYGITNNSYKVSSGTPGEFKGEVPFYNLGGGGVYAVPVTRGDIAECLAQFNMFENNHRSSLTGADCSHYDKLAMDWLTFLGAARPMESSDGDVEGESKKLRIDGALPALTQPNSEKYTVLTEVMQEPNNAIFQYYNLLDFNSYVVNKNSKQLDCRPSIQLKTTNTATHVGLIFATNGCDELIRPLQFNTNFFAHPFLKETGVKWNTTRGESRDNLIVTEMAIAKEALIDRHETGFEYKTTVYVMIPFSPSLHNFMITSAPQKSMRYSEERPAGGVFEGLQGFGGYGQGTNNPAAYNQGYFEGGGSYSGRMLKVDLFLHSKGSRSEPVLDMKVQPITFGDKPDTIANHEGHDH